MIKLSENQKKIINELGHELYTPEYIETWINRKDTVLINAPCALQSCFVKGYFEAVLQIEKMEAAHNETIRTDRRI